MGRNPAVRTCTGAFLCSGGRPPLVLLVSFALPGVVAAGQAEAVRVQQVPADVPVSQCWNTLLITF